MWQWVGPRSGGYHNITTCLQARAVQGGQQQQQQQPGAGKKAAGLVELLTQKLLSLDNVVVEGDPEVRAARKGEVVRINRLCDSLEPSAAAGRQ